MKKSKIACITAGVFVLGSASVYAGQYMATENPFPIQLNGNSVQLEGYNIDGSTYFKLRDIAEIVGGFNVGFSDNTILISNDGYVNDDSTADSAKVYYDTDYEFQLKIPAEWEGRYVMNVSPAGDNYLKRIDFYEQNNYYVNNELGRLFSIYVCGKNNMDKDTFIYGDSYHVLGEQGNIIVFSVTPLDVPSLNEYMNEWHSLMDEYKSSICDTFEWKSSSEKYTAANNSFPILFNGQSVSIEGYNIDGSTYFKLRDVADVVGGFNVDFNNNTIQLSKDGYVYDNNSAADVLNKYVGIYKYMSDDVLHSLVITEIDNEHVVFYCDDLSVRRLYYRGPFTAVFTGENYAIGEGHDSYYGTSTKYSLTFNGDEISAKCEDFEGAIPITFNINTDRVNDNSIDNFLNVRKEEVGY